MAENVHINNKSKYEERILFASLKILPNPFFFFGIIYSLHSIIKISANNQSLTTTGSG